MDGITEFTEALKNLPAGMLPGFAYIAKLMVNPEQPYTNITEAEARQIALDHPETAPLIDAVLANLQLSAMLFKYGE